MLLRNLKNLKIFEEKYVEQEKVAHKKRERYFFNGDSFAHNLKYKISHVPLICETQHILTDLSHLDAINYLAFVCVKMYEPLDIRHLFDCHLYDKNVEYWNETYIGILPGTTSKPILVRLMREEYQHTDNTKQLVKRKPLADHYFATINIDSNGKPIPWSNTENDNNSHKPDAETLEDAQKLSYEVKKQTQLMMELIKDDKNMNNIIFEKNCDVLPTNLDYNSHVNQGIYTYWIENCMLDTDKDYFEGKYFMSDLFIRFMGEVKYKQASKNIDGKHQNKCTIVIVKFVENKKNKEYTGVIKQNNKVTTVFKCILQNATNSKL